MALYLSFWRFVLHFLLAGRLLVATVFLASLLFFLVRFGRFDTVSDFFAAIYTVLLKYF